jgi:FkbM family methyltransferase
MGYYGQDGEDKIIEQYFSSGYIGRAIDVGATDGIYINNTLHFEELGWDVICFEPNPGYFYQCQNNRKNAHMYAISNTNEDDVDFHVVNLDGYGIEEAITSLKIDHRLLQQHVDAGYNPKIKTIKTQTRTLNWCIENHFSQGNIDFVSIDTEGTELDVLRGFDINKYMPKLFIIENNFEDNSIEEYLLKFGYVKDQHIVNNDFYIRKNKINIDMETFGNLIDKLTIVNMKIWKFEDIKRDSNDDKIIADACKKTNVLNVQRNDLIQEIDQMLIDASNGIVNFKDYKQGDTKTYGT